MRKLILLGMLAAAAMQAGATRHVTVAQLEKTLAASVAKHRSDADLVREFGDFVLTERLTDAARSRICDTLHLGPKTTVALQLLGDQSAFLDPPAADLPVAAPPDAPTAKHILDAASAYITNTMPHLPDVLATRTTYSFDDTPQVFKVNEWPVRAGLHLVGNSSREITFRDDHGSPAAAPDPARTAPSAPAKQVERGLQSWGEFGPLLGVIFVDTERGALSFHHWEQASGTLVAVFRYTVPKSVSHYSVNYCCLSDGPRLSSRKGEGGRGGYGGGGTPLTGNTRGASNTQGDATILFHKIPGYHGSLFIDPATGVVRRVTLEAEMDGSPVSEAATVIEYGPVVIGDRKFICPLRSMNLYEGPAESGAPSSELPVSVTASQVPTGTLHVNETSFTNYHRLGSTIRILTEADAPPAANP
jgi:hypothetical protein